MSEDLIYTATVAWNLKSLVNTSSIQGGKFLYYTRAIWLLRWVFDSGSYFYYAPGWLVRWTTPVYWLFATLLNIRNVSFNRFPEHRQRRTPLGKASRAKRSITESLLEQQRCSNAETLAHLPLSHTERVFCEMFLLSKDCSIAALVQSALTEDEKM
jgi:hypothetical protein